MIDARSNNFIPVRPTLAMIWGLMFILALLGWWGITAVYPMGASKQAVVFVLMILILSVTATLASQGYIKRQRLRRIGDRQEVSPEEIYNQYYRDSGLNQEAVVRIWQEIAKILALPAEKLRPTDRFDRELAHLKVWFYYDVAANQN